MIGICNFSSLAVYNAGGLFGGRFSLYITLGVGILAAYNARVTTLEDCANSVDFGWGCSARHQLTLCTAFGYALHGISLCSAQRLVTLCTASVYALHSVRG